jgi:glucosyl-3-phosphoglycerate synthase
MNGSTARTFDPTGWDVSRAVVAKARAGAAVTLCFPCRNEAPTIGPLVTAAIPLVDAGLLDEVLVLDDRSTDDTAAMADAAGARVVAIEDVHATHGVGDGKGNALWASLIASRGDLVVWCDGDVTTFEPAWVARLLAPLLADPTVDLVKASYHRPTNLGGGGRTTELVARPLLSLYAPGLAVLDQPLAGEFAGRRSALEQIPFVEGWGAEIAMLLDLAELSGPSSIAQVDLGERRHRHRDLHELSLQAAEVLATVMLRVGAPTIEASNGDGTPQLRRADGSTAQLNVRQRPPALAGSSASGVRGALVARHAGPQVSLAALRADADAYFGSEDLVGDS